MSSDLRHPDVAEAAWEELQELRSEYREKLLYLKVDLTKCIEDLDEGYEIVAKKDAELKARWEVLNIVDNEADTVCGWSSDPWTFPHPKFPRH